MKYIGPFLRLNSLTLDNIKTQIFHLSKETIKTLALNSKCGIQISYKEFIKNIPNFDNNTKSSFYPLLCLYKKASPKITFKHDKMLWNESKFKKEVDIPSNAFLTLSLLELSEYYKQFENIKNSKYKLAQIYTELAKKQLEFYGNHLRNQEGLFVNMLDVADPLMGDYKFEDKAKNFKFSHQAFMMCAYYKCSLSLEEDEGKSFKLFAYDILKMFMTHREELYSLPYSEIVKLCLALNIFYIYSREFEVKTLLMDLNDLLRDSHDEYSQSTSGKKLDVDLMLFLNYYLMFKNTSITKYKDDSEKLFTKLSRHYNSDVQNLFKDSDSKEISYSSNEIILYFIMTYISAIHNQDDDDINRMCVGLYKNSVVNSGIILSWPDSPSLDDPERYMNFSSKSEDLLDEQHFKLPSIGTPKTLELASIFAKKITYVKKKDMFKQSKTSFDSTKNMHLFYLFIMLEKHLDIKREDKE
ncbi:hypothetical protein [Oceanirhabdus seepicola]|uniref:Uncharacterized protein n=1 Tax=Oceanirhabdus seepicola TaxID=2828781 RepID=A0A9J6P195_9CLOT|nr:hypothetical protein [Oceanirhabdus seepicola]MCM1990431.1 hypothetical protein [Oceanirhabdus seepicola]